MLAGNLAIMSRLREACVDRTEMLSAIERQRARLERRLLIAEAKAALLERDFGRARTVFASIADGAGSRRERAIAALGQTRPELLRTGYLGMSKCRSVLAGRRQSDSHMSVRLSRESSAWDSARPVVKGEGCP